MERKKGGKNKFAFDTFENSGNRSEWPSLSRENPVLLRKGKRMEGGKEREREEEDERGRKWMQNNKRPVGHVDRGVIF